MTQALWHCDPDDPRAPPEEIWARLSLEERARAVEALPAEVPLDVHPPEGDPHRIPIDRARDALSAFFRAIGRSVYVSRRTTRTSRASVPTSSRSSTSRRPRENDGW